MNQKRFNILQSWPYLLGLILGLYFIVLNITGVDLTYFPGDLGDGRFNAYILEHAYQYFSGNLNSFWDAPFMYPEKEMITFSDNLLGTAPLYSIFRMFGADIFTSFQLWFILVTILNYSSAYLFINWLLKNKYAAVMGAFVFAFSIALQSQMTHAQTFPRFFIPLAIWMMLLFIQGLKPKHFFLMLLFTVLQFYNGIYLGFMLVIPLTFFLVILCIIKRKSLVLKLKEAKWFFKILLASLLNAVFLMLLMLPYFQRSLVVGESLFEQVVQTIPLFKSYLYCQPGSPIWGFLTNVGAELNASWDHQLFSGAITTVSFIAFLLLIIFNKKLKLNSSIELKLMAIVAGLTFLFVVRVNEFTLYHFFYSLPGFSSMRSMTRIINIELLFFSVAVAFVAFLLIKRFNKYTIPLFLLFLTALTIDNYFKEGSAYRSEKKVVVERLNLLKNKMKHIPTGSVVSYEPIERDFPIHVYQIDAMLAAQSLGLKTVNGYSGNSPVAYQSFWHEINEEARIKWFEANNFTPDTLYVIH